VTEMEEIHRGVRCTRVESWVHGWYWVKFADTPEPVKKAYLSTRHCPEDATVTVEHEGMTFRWCATHAKTPTCGAPVLNH
jgi:hypothetical protein